MRYLNLLLIMIIMHVLVSCDSRSVEKHKLYGTIVYYTSGENVDDAKVYLIDSNSNIVLDESSTNSIGNYSFYDVDTGIYNVYAEKYLNATDSIYEFVTPFSDQIDFSNEEVSSPVDDLNAHILNDYGSVSGTVYDSTNVVFNAGVNLYIWLDQEFSLHSETVTDAVGDYTLPGVMTGNYYVEVMYGMNSATSQIFFNNGISVIDIEDIHLY
ncbi:MAG: carboxypeptidase regulatory-like domain-containing protein [Candidatus Cloacimonetes bacterium]|nr:carboxypeptidase regulatory-like domain-containing protein [Candidatus Cloacimonadota bacterium]